MDKTRRGFLLGLGAIIAAPAIVRASSLMPVKAVREYSDVWWDYDPFMPPRHFNCRCTISMDTSAFDRAMSEAQKLIAETFRIPEEIVCHPSANLQYGTNVIPFRRPFLLGHAQG